MRWFGALGWVVLLVGCASSADEAVGPTSIVGSASGAPTTAVTTVSPTTVDVPAGGATTTVPVTTVQSTVPTTTAPATTTSGTAATIPSTTVPVPTPAGHPRICQPWAGVGDRPDLTEMEAIALHDLWWTGTWRMGLQWEVDDDQRYVGLSTTLTDVEGDRDLTVARERRAELHRLNPDLKVLITLLYREASYQADETDLRWWEIGHYPPDSPLWIRDADGDPVPGFGEDADADGTIEPDETLSSLLDFRQDEVIELVAQRALAVEQSGVADGVFLDWWNEHSRTAASYLGGSVFYMTLEEEVEARLRLLRRMRELVGDDFLILLNTNDATAPRSAPLANGTFMELWKPDWSAGYTLEQLVRFEETLSWATEAFREPRINCLQGWRVVTDYGNDAAKVDERNSPENRRWMRLFTTMALTHSNELVVFEDDNAEPGENFHNWYPFWDADLGQPVGERRMSYEGVDGLFIREFTNGYAVYNRSGQSQWVTLPVVATGVSSWHTGSMHRVDDMDGEILLRTPAPEPVDSGPPSPIDRDPGELLRVVLTGDSITDQVAPYLRWILGRTATVERRHHGGTALCDWFVDQGEELGMENLEDWQPHVFVVDHGGNALTPCMADGSGAPLAGVAYTAKNLADAERVVALAARTDSRVLFVDQPVGRGDGRSGTHEVFRSMPGRHPGGSVRYLSTWPAVSPGGRFLQSASCEATEPGCVDGVGELRSPWPNGHLEALGAWRYARAIVDEFVAAGWVDAADVDVSDRAMP